MDEAIASSQIEGAATTRRVAKEMLRTGRPPQTRGERMILNNFRTVSRIGDLGDKPLTTSVLLELQASLTEGTLADPGEVGRLRTPIDDDDIIVGDGLKTPTSHTSRLSICTAWRKLLRSFGPTWSRKLRRTSNSNINWRWAPNSTIVKGRC